MKAKAMTLIEESVDTHPGRVAEIMVELSAIYAYFSETLKNNQIFKADKWMELRATLKSDKSTDRMWDSLEEGKTEIKLRSILKAIEKQQSSIKLLLRTKENESWGRY